MEGAADRLYCVARGVRDDRARLAFREGQCHALALTLHQQTGWDLVAIENDGVCEHITVRHPDGHLIDILGGHPDGLPGSEDSVEREIDQSYIDELVAEGDWSPPDLEAAGAWVGGVLDLAAGPPDATHAGFAQSWSCDDGRELRLEWRGRAYMEVFLRSSASEEWVLSSPAFLPLDEATGRHQIDFTQEEFERLAPILAAAIPPASAA